ncbi:hypothetical protein, partial [Thiolapillus sp.]|uniref:hypothetical protein n=5 Tax=Thiolapillus sp. TaxID=2017437 RepID=UPI003AF9FDC0
MNMNNLIQVERGCMICSINIWLRAVAVHFSTPLRLYQPYACATDTDGEGQKNGQKLTHQSGEEPKKRPISSVAVKFPGVRPESCVLSKWVKGPPLKPGRERVTESCVRVGNG